MHNKQLLGLAVAGLFIGGCSNSTLVPSNNDKFKVETIPSGATVYVMGEIVGTTPLELETKQVFPRLYPSDQTHLYGRVFLSHEGCEEFTTPVGTTDISRGMKVKLRCEPMRPVAQPVEVAPQPPMKDIKERLRDLKALFEEGLINQQDYDAKRSEILKGL